MKIGLYHHPQDPPDGKNLVRRWEETLAATVALEEAGWDGSFLPEHHMMPDGYPPSPWAGLGAMAALTKRIHLGTTVHLLPFEHPIHVAEHTAMLDQIAGGRIRLGVGLANFEPEFELYGLEKKTQVSRFEECVDLLLRAWAGEEIDFDGKHFQVKGRVTPQPIDAELWLGAMSDAGVRRAARLGQPWVADPLHNIDVIKRWADLYREEAAAHGNEDKAKIIVLRDGWVTDTVEEAEKIWWPTTRADRWFYFQQIPRWVQDLEPTLVDLKSEDDFKFEEHRTDRLITGPPEYCVEELLRWHEVIGTDYIVMALRKPTGPSHDLELENIARFGEQVIAPVKNKLGDD